MAEIKQKIRVFSFTRTGTELNKKICGRLRRMGKTCAGYAVKKYADAETEPLPEDIRGFTGEDWADMILSLSGRQGSRCGTLPRGSKINSRIRRSW